MEDKKSAVWCLGKHTEKLLEYTDLLKYQIDFFIDKNANDYQIHEVYGRSVYTPEEVDFTKIDCVVISSFKYQEDISTFLKLHGAADQAVLLYTANDEGEFYHLPRENNADYYFTGNYHSWQEARRHVRGYEDESIAKKVLSATKQVMEQKACFERDSVLFYTNEYNFRLISLFGLLASEKKHIHILDFGGALGSEYWRNRAFFYQFGVDFTWNIVEQDTYVFLGQKEVSNHELKFYHNMDQLKEEQTDLILLSSVLQYLPDYQNILSELTELGARYILIERQAVCERSRICIQYVGENIYNASYPVRIIGEYELMDILSKKYRKVTEFDSEADGGIAYVDGREFRYKGYLMERRKE